MLTGPTLTFSPPGRRARRSGTLTPINLDSLAFCPHAVAGVGDLRLWVDN